MHSTRALLVFCLALWAASGSPVLIDAGPRDESYLLSPTSTPTPQTYTIRLSPDLDQATFSGSASIDVTATSSSGDQIVLHSATLAINKIEVLDVEGQDLYSGHALDVTRDFLTISLTGTLQPYANYTIKIQYQGVLHDDMYGFYRSTYIASDNSERKIAATQFQPTHARKAFPCFDEPRYKAKFRITIDTPAGYHSLSNSQEVDGPPGNINERRDVEFEETPKMSTYLVAFIVSDFEFVADVVDGVLYQSWARSNAIEGAEYSIAITPSITRAMEDFTGVDYLHSGLTKVDQVALPDFSAGAMENWGLITYRETALLYKPEMNTAANKQRVATVIGHEIVHMWFGNLITTQWWDSTWLNEGFARYFQYYSASKVETAWRLMEQFVVNEHQAIFGTDALPSAHPLTSSCYTPAQVSAMFSGLTYSKGGSILRMLSHSLSEETFKKALRTYLIDRQFDTVTPQDLMDHIDRQAKADGVLPPSVDAMGIIRSWTEQSGFPVVTVTRCYDDNTAMISQEQFLLSQDESSNKIWKIPITWATEDSGFMNTRPVMWLTTAEEAVSGLPAADKWVIFNVQEAGYYRVNYDEDNWRMLVAALKFNHSVIHPLNRAQLVDDALNLARAGELTYHTALSLIEYLREELDYIPWVSAHNAFTFLNRRLNGHADYSYFKAHILELVNKVYEELGFEDTEDHVQRLHRNIVLTWACNMDHKACNQNVDRKFKELMENGVKVKPDLQSVVYCSGLRNGDYLSWQYLWQQYQRSLDFSEKTLILSALGCTTNQTTLQEYLLKSIDPSGVIRKQDASSVFSAVYSNPTGVNAALQFLQSNFEAISNYYGSMGSIGNIVRGIAAQVSTEDQHQQLKNFVAENKDALGTAGEAALQTAEENLVWTTTNQEHIFAYLKDSGSSTITPPPSTSTSNAPTPSNTPTSDAPTPSNTPTSDAPTPSNTPTSDAPTPSNTPTTEGATDSPSPETTTQGGSAQILSSIFTIFACILGIFIIEL